MTLREAIGERELHHYTIYHALENILKTGNLRLRDYVGTPKGTGQLATVRPSMISKENLENLSGGSNGGIKIIIDASKASDAVRGLKVKTIAELPLMFKEQIEGKVGKRNRNNIQKIMKELLSMLKIHPSLNSYLSTHETKEKTKEIIGDKAFDAVKEFMDKWNIKLTQPAELINTAKRYRRYVKEREGEERLTIKDTGRNKKHSFLPLNKKYIKIELMKQPNKAAGLNKQYMEKLVRQMKKHKDLFIKNDIYKDIISKKD